MDEPIGSSMLDGTDFVARLDVVERRLERLAASGTPQGLTEPDPDTEERWEASQVWAHMAEFVPFWRGELERVVAAFDGDPVPFGRTKADPARIAGIEMGRREPVTYLQARVHEEMAELRRYLSGLTAAEWNAVGRYVRGNEMDLEAIAERFLINHLEEHADQLEALTKDAE
jgi:DinB family protein